MAYAVVIPSRGRPAMLERALASVYAQTLPPARVHLVIDETAGRPGYDFTGKYDDSLDVVFTGGGYGGAGSRNVALERVEEEFVFFLDDDDEWLPEKAEKQLRLLREHPEAAGVTCAFYECLDGRRTLIDQPAEQMRRCRKIWNYTGGFSCFGMRRRDELAGLRLREELRSAQDLEFYIRVCQFGDIVKLEEPQVLFRVHRGPRISGNRLEKRNSYLEILRLDRDMFGIRDYCFTVAKAELTSAAARESPAAMIAYHLKGLAYLLAACREPRLSFLMWWNGVRSMVRRVRRGSLGQART